MDIDDLPTLKESIPPLFDLIDTVRRDITELVPGSAPWSWSGELDTNGCVTRGVEVYYPLLRSAHAFTDAEWERVLPVVARRAAEAGLTGLVPGPAHKPGNYDVSFTNADTRELRLASRDASLITARIGCRRPGDGLWVGDRLAIPVPPVPES